MKHLMISLIAICLLLVACEDEKTVTEYVEVETPYDSFSCEIVVRNGAYEPLEGYLVQLSSYDLYSIHARPVTPIKFTIEDYGTGSCPTTLLLTDYWDRFVSLPIDRNLSPGVHSLVWNGCNYLDEPLVQGVYKGFLTVHSDDEIVMHDTLYTYLLQGIGNDIPSVRTTTSEGIALFTDITPLPGLYCEYNFPEYNNNGEFVGYMDLSPDSYIFVQNPDGEIRRTRREMTDGENSFSVVWEEMSGV